MKEIKLLDKLQERAVRQIHFGNKNLTLHVIEDMYNIVPLQERRKRHHLLLMYRLSSTETYLEPRRPEVNLRSRRKVKFATRATKLTIVTKSHFYRGMSLWDRLAITVQRATTKVRFKQLIV